MAELLLPIHLSSPLGGKRQVRGKVRFQLGRERKGYGILWDKEEVVVGRRVVKKIEAQFLNGEREVHMVVEVDITEIVSKGVKAEEVEVNLMLANREGIVVYLPPQYDRNVERWEREEREKGNRGAKGKRRYEIVGRYRIWEWMVGKAREEMERVFRRAMAGEVIEKEINVPPHLFTALECKSKEMTHMHYLYMFDEESGIFYFQALNNSKLSWKEWMELSRRVVTRVALNRRVRFLFPPLLRSGRSNPSPLTAPALPINDGMSSGQGAASSASSATLKRPEPTFERRGYRIKEEGSPYIALTGLSKERGSPPADGVHLLPTPLPKERRDFPPNLSQKRGESRKRPPLSVLQKSLQKRAEGMVVKKRRGEERTKEIPKGIPKEVKRKRDRVKDRKRKRGQRTAVGREVRISRGKEMVSSVGIETPRGRGRSLHRDWKLEGEKAAEVVRWGQAVLERQEEVKVEGKGEALPLEGRRKAVEVEVVGEEVHHLIEHVSACWTC